MVEDVARVEAGVPLRRGEDAIAQVGVLVVPRQEGLAVDVIETVTDLEMLVHLGTEGQGRESLAAP